MNGELIVPFVSSTINVFTTMLDCSLQRGTVYRKQFSCPEHHISAVIGLSGKGAGTVVLSLDRHVALMAAEALLGEKQFEINCDVKDAVGELANMVAGGAKAQLAELDLSLTIPTVITGKFSIDFPSKSAPMCIPFESPWGPLSIEVGLRTPDSVETATPAAAATA